MRILMVCLGNICRSPLAEGIMRQKAWDAGIEIDVDSRGTSGFHIGESPDHRTQKNALSHGIDLSQLKAAQFRAEDFDSFDIIFVMDKDNFRNVADLARNANDMSKIRLILTETDEKGYPSEVPDPYFGGEAGFEVVYQLLDRSCRDFLNKRRK